jgi:hypothetical protein
MASIKYSERPRIERLEDRCVPAIFGQVWPNANITISFAPDGTATPNGPSNLFQSLSATMSQSDWEQSILDAFVAWDAAAPISFQVVGDGGQAAGTPGAPQGDSRFGDIRIYGASLGPEVLSVTVPYDGFISGTLAGDIVVNTDIAFTPERLKTAMLQEVGHALGLDNSLDPTSVMFQWEHGATQLAPSDVFAIQALYGMNSGSAPLHQTTGQLTAAGQATHTLQAPWTAGSTLTLSVVLPSGGSMPGVIVRDAMQQQVATEVLVTNAGQLTLRVANTTPGMTYTVQLISTNLAAPTSYLLLHQFSTQPAPVVSFLQGNVSGNGVQAIPLNLAMPLYFQFSLQAVSQDVTMSIRNASGSLISSFTVAAGQTQTAPTVFLRAGAYTVEFSANSATTFRLFGMDLSDPIGVKRPGGAFLPPPGGPSTAPPTTRPYPEPPPQEDPLPPGPPAPPAPPPPPPTSSGRWWWFGPWLPFMPR